MCKSASLWYTNPLSQVQVQVQKKGKSMSGVTFPELPFHETVAKCDDHSQDSTIELPVSQLSLKPHTCFNSC